MDEDRGSPGDGGEHEPDGRAGEADGRAGEADGRAGEADGRAGEADGRAGEADGRAGEADGRAGEADGQAGDDEETLQRDLGLGHPLSPESGKSGSDPTGSDTARPDEGEGPEAEAFDPVADGEESTYSRRDLLLGGVAGAVAASLGWAGVLASSDGSGPSGDAESAAVDYVNALADNDWERAGALFHEDSQFRQETDSYETFLDERGQLDVFTNISPSVEAQYVRFHIPDVDEAVEADDDFVLRGGIDPDGIDEWKQVLVIASVQVDNLNLSAEAESDYLAVSVTADFNITLVRDSRGWHISQTFGSPLIF